MNVDNIYEGCPVQHALKYIGGKWQMGILWNLKEKELRFGEIKKLLPGITEKVLTQELNFFVEKGILQKQVYANVPPKVEYRLTERGMALIPVITIIVKWGYENLQNEKLDKNMLCTPIGAIEKIEEEIRKQVN